MELRRGDWGRWYASAASSGKFARAGLEATGLYSLCLAWALGDPADNGVVPDEQIERFAGRRSKALRVKLIDARLWEDGTGSIVIHDYRDHQTTRTSREKKRDDAALRQANFRESNALLSEKSRVATEREVERELTTTPKPPRGAVASGSLDDVKAVARAYCDSTGRNGNWKLNEDRRRKIAKALKDYPLDDVLDAVRGWEYEPWYRGENPESKLWNEIELLLQNSKNIEKFRDAWRRRGPATLQPKVKPMLPDGDDAGHVARVMEGKRRVG